MELQDEDEDPILDDNIEQFHSRDSLQLSIGFYEPQKHNEAKAAAKHELHQSNMDENQMEKESLGQVTLSLGSGTASSEGAMVSYENQIRHEKEKEREREREEEENNLLGLIHRENQIATSCIYSIQIRNAFPPL